VEAAALDVEPEESSGGMSSTSIFGSMPALVSDCPAPAEECERCSHGTRDALNNLLDDDRRSALA
jgi:hypothetical protein